MCIRDRDAGVHAHQYFAHINIEEEWDFDFVFRINKMLPEDIAIYQVIESPPKANAQLDAIQRTYEYQVHFNKNPFLAATSALYLVDQFDFHKMSKAAFLLTQYQDFRSFCITPDAHNHTFCTIYDLQLFQQNESCLLYTSPSPRDLSTSRMPSSA